MSEYKTLVRAGRAETEVKKSRFIAVASPVASEEEALALIEAERAAMPDATHTVYAYILRENNTARFNDDGEPHGTAGVPVLEVLRKEGVCDAVIAVTRYFGGTLLGAGGLVRAYTGAAKAALDEAGVGVQREWRSYTICMDYASLDKTEYEMKKLGAVVEGTEYSDRVTLRLSIRAEATEALESCANRLFSGSADIKATGVFFSPS